MGEFYFFEIDKITVDCVSPDGKSLVPICYWYYLGNDVINYDISLFTNFSETGRIMRLVNGEPVLELIRKGSLEIVNILDECIKNDRFELLDLNDENVKQRYNNYLQLKQNVVDRLSSIPILFPDTVKYPDLNLENMIYPTNYPFRFKKITKDERDAGVKNYVPVQETNKDITPTEQHTEATNSTEPVNNTEQYTETTNSTESVNSIEPNKIAFVVDDIISTVDTYLKSINKKYKLNIISPTLESNVQNTDNDSLASESHTIPKVESELQSVNDKITPNSNDVATNNVTEETQKPIDNETQKLPKVINVARNDKLSNYHFSNDIIEISCVSGELTVVLK